MNYIYDGTFEGYLTCVYEHFRTEKAHNICKEENFQEDLLHRSISVKTDEVKSDKVYNGIISKISGNDLMRVYRVLGSIVDDREMKCLRYLEMGFKIGRDIWLLHGNPIVHDVEEADRKVGIEIHRMIGLIRFSTVTPVESVRPSEEQQDILYSAIEPDNDIVEFLVHHFKDRFKEDPFIIHDTKRDKAVVYGRGKWCLTNFGKNDVFKYSDSEIKHRKLWKLYFQTIGIRERVNPKCQKNFMPARYWKNLVEIDADNGL